MPKEPEYFSTQVTDARRWFLALPKPAERGIVTVSVGCERCLPDYVVERDTFEFQGLEFVAEGEGSLELQDRIHSLQPGAVFSYGPGIRHRIRNTSDRPMRKYFLDCGGIAARERFEESSVGGGRIVRLGGAAEIVDLFEMLIRTAMNESEQSARICSSLVEALLLKITEQTVTGGGTDHRAWATYERIRRHIQENHLRLRTMREVARETGVDPAYLARVFRRFHKVGPYRFLMRLKMSHAASRLLSPPVLVKEIAGDLGFADPFHFSRAFKAVYGVSPEQFARRRDEPGA
ncbi:MAG: helix-turn-helix transcriptional regulator [Verrucomicrobiae bacterium]|nr:helix-turn-helix transcriptional regulator [Verrucomicrobiae bacterium]